MTRGAQFRVALTQENPLQIVGTVNAYSALLAEQAGFRAIYLSGAGIANASLGLPDLGLTNLNDVLEDARRITNRSSLPLLVDIDTGFGTAFGIARTIRELINSQVAAAHIEDQVQSKRCGHRPGKAIVETQEMVDRIKACVDARTDDSFVIMARTDALAIEGLPKTLERIQHYIEAGADMIFFEGATDLNQYRTVTETFHVPVLANITEFGVTPLFTKEELKEVGIQMILYPLSAYRAMSLAALKVYETLHCEGTQKSLIEQMQTRADLYKVLNYHSYEEKINELFAKRKNHE